jgi:hypothetical protein
MTGGRVDQADVHRILLDHTNRIRALEATPTFGVAKQIEVSVLLSMLEQITPIVVGLEAETQPFPGTAAFSGARGTLCGTWTLPIGGYVSLFAFNFDTVDHDAQLISGQLQEIGSSDRESYGGDLVTIPAGGGGYIPITRRGGGTATILDLTDPDQPQTLVAATLAATFTFEIR